jgi:hypothetical protein
MSALAFGLVLITGCGKEETTQLKPGVEAGTSSEGSGESLSTDLAAKAAAAKAALEKQAAEAAAYGKKTAEETAAKLADAATAARAEAVKSLKATADALYPQLEALRKHGESLDPVKKSVFNPIMAGLDQKFGEAMKTIGSMGSANDWEAIKNKLGPMLEDLKAGITTATKSFM